MRRAERQVELNGIPRAVSGRLIVFWVVITIHVAHMFPKGIKHLHGPPCEGVAVGSPEDLEFARYRGRIVVVDAMDRQRSIELEFAVSIACGFREAAVAGFDGDDIDFGTGDWIPFGVD